MSRIITGWVPDRPDRNDYTLENLVKADELRIIEAIGERENDIISLLNLLIDKLNKTSTNTSPPSKNNQPDAKSSNKQFEHLQHRLKHHYGSMVTLQEACLATEKTNFPKDHVTVNTVSFEYLKTFYRLAFFDSRSQLDTLRKADPLQFSAVVEAFYPLIEIATILGAPVNRFNSRKKNVLFLIHNLYLPLALSAARHLPIQPRHNQNIEWEKVTQRGDCRNQYQEFRSFALLNHPSHTGDDVIAMTEICEKVWTTICGCYQNIDKLTSKESLPEENSGIIDIATLRESLKQDICQFIKNSLQFFGFSIQGNLGPSPSHEKVSEAEPNSIIEISLQKKQIPEQLPVCLSVGQAFKLVKLVDESELENILDLEDESETEGKSESEGKLKSEIHASSEEICIKIPILQSQISDLVKTKGVLRLPGTVDLTPWCSPIENQGSLQACSSHAAVSLVEYFQKRSAQGYYESSRLFLYKVTRDLMQVSGNVGTSLRETMKAMVLFGTPPEKYWPYDETKLDTQPDAFCFAYAQNYQALKYFRLDPLGQPDKLTLLFQIKALLAAGFPCAFGFTLYRSAYLESLKDGNIPLPCDDDLNEGGHAVVAVGYADDHVVLNADGEPSNISTEYSRQKKDRQDLEDRKNIDPIDSDKYFAKGALLIRNCWGADWGEHGYGWLPYAYIKEGLTSDWWSLVKAEWLNTAQFGLGCDLNLGPPPPSPPPPPAPPPQGPHQNIQLPD